jgi:L-arabinonolactonase
VERALGRLAADRYAPDGRIKRVVEMPVPQPSCPAFGGPDLDVLCISSAAIGMSAADFASAPEGGGLFTLEAGGRGLPVKSLRRVRRPGVAC